MKKKRDDDGRTLDENERTASEGPDIMDQDQESGRRKLLKALGGGSVLAAFGGILPDEWKSPVTEEIVDAIAPPAHAGAVTSSPGPVSTLTPSPTPGPVPSPTPVPTLQDLIEASDLQGGVKNSLLKKLEKGNVRPFINEVNGLLNAGKITEEQATAWINAANAL